MNKRAFFASFLEVAGTSASALGTSPRIISQEKHRTRLDMIGNLLQALGSSYALEGEEDLLLKAASASEATGNLMNLFALLVESSETEKVSLTMKGDLFQATGAAVYVNKALEEGNPLEIGAKLLHFTGNSLEALGELASLKNEENLTNLNLIGSWLQAIGSLISCLLLYQSKGSQVKRT